MGASASTAPVRARRTYALFVPVWATAGAPLAVVAGVVGTAVRRRRNRPRPGLCRRCGYDLRATPVRCPECGADPGG